MWNETLNFVIHTPELALVRFVVEDYDKASRNDFIGQFTLPLTCIQAGESSSQSTGGIDIRKAGKLICDLFPSRIPSHTSAL